MSPSPSRARLALFGAVVILYLGVTPYFGGIRNPNELVRVYMTVAMAEQGTFAVDAMEQRWGWVNDKARFDGHAYSSKAPGTSFLGLPVLVVHRAVTRALGHTPDLREIVLVLRLGAVTLPTLVFLWFFLGWCERRAAPPHAHAVFVSVAAGSLLYGYGLTFVSHTLNAACAFGAVMALDDAGGAARTGPRAHARAALAGLLCTAATMFEYPAALATFAVGVFALVRLWPRPGRARLVSFALGGVPPVAATMLFHAVAFGSPWSTGYAHLDNPTFRSNIAQGFFGASLPSPEALGRLLADPAFGLFVGTPILLLALPGAVRGLRERRAETVLSLAVFVLVTLFVSSLNNWRGGWTVGPRYLSTVVPFLAGPALAGLEALGARRPGLASILGGTATLLALALSGVPSALYPHVPESFTFPLGQLLLPLLRSGHVPYTLGGLLGLPGLWALTPVVVAAALLAARAARPVDLGFAAGLAAAVLALALALAPVTEAQRAALAHVERNWEPRPATARGNPAAQRGRDAARRGEVRRALERWSRSP